MGPLKRSGANAMTVSSRPISLDIKLITCPLRPSTVADFVIRSACVGEWIIVIVGILLQQLNTISHPQMVPQFDGQLSPCDKSMQRRKHESADQSANCTKRTDDWRKSISSHRIWFRRQTNRRHLSKWGPWPGFLRFARNMWPDRQGIGVELFCKRHRSEKCWLNRLVYDANSAGLTLKPHRLLWKRTIRLTALRRTLARIHRADWETFWSIPFPIIQCICQSGACFRGISMTCKCPLVQWVASSPTRINLSTTKTTISSPDVIFHVDYLDIRFSQNIYAFRMAVIQLLLEQKQQRQHDWIWCTIRVSTSSKKLITFLRISSNICQLSTIGLSSTYSFISKPVTMRRDINSRLWYCSFSWKLHKRMISDWTGALTNRRTHWILYANIAMASMIE